MKVVLRLNGSAWWTRRLAKVNPVEELTAEEKFRRLVNAALATPYYSRRDRAEMLLSAQSLNDLPTLGMRDLLDARGKFLNPKAAQARAMLRLPFRTEQGVLIGRKLRTPAGVQFIEEGWLGRMHLSETRMLAATPGALRRIIAAVEARAMALPRLSEAVVVLQGAEEGVLFPGERDMIWRSLGVPVFEQWLGLDGELIAAECGMHQGLHFQYGRAELEERHNELIVTSWFGLRTPVLRLRTPWQSEVDTRVCRCGDERPLLKGLEWKRSPGERRYAMAVA